MTLCLFRFRFFDIPKGVLLPEIRSCSEIYGQMTDGPLCNIPISGVIYKFHFIYS